MLTDLAQMPEGAARITPKAHRWLLCLAFFLLLCVPARASDFPPSIPPPRPVAIPVPKVSRLDNGLQVMVIEQRSLPVVTLRLTVKSGAGSDPADLPGLAEMVAALLNQGTAARSAPEISAAIDQMGGVLESAAEWDSSYAFITVLSDHIDDGFQILAEMILHPAFPKDELDRRRKQTLSALEVLKDDPSSVADRVFDLLVFAGTPYGHPLDGTPESLRRMTPADLLAFKKANYVPENAVLSVVGDISESDGLRLAREYFGDWAKGQGTRASAKPPDPGRGGRVVIIDKPDAVQTEIRVGTRGIPRNSPDYEALTAANQILGGPATNRLFKTLRTQQGLTYGASSQLLCRRFAGDWVAKTSTRTSGTAEALEAVLQQLKRLRDHPMSDNELGAAKSYLLGHMALEFETSEDMAGHFVDLAVQGLPLDSWKQFGQRIEKLRAEDVFAATRAVLGSGENIIVLVGNAAAFRGDLKKLGPARIIPLSELDFAKLAGSGARDPKPND